jgi:hypothetical protein
MPEPVSMPVSASSDGFINDAPAPIAQAPDHAAGDMVSLETMRSAMVSNFEQNDLDVPAFLRKRNELM